MTIRQKLIIIKKESGLTQEGIAKQLGVSFVTLNSWMNERSKPHLKKQNQIDELYKKYTGQQTIPDNELIAKKELINKKSRKHQNIIKIIREHKDIYDQFKLSLTYNSNSIEGNTLTKRDTASVLFNNITLPDKSLIEHLEAKNHGTAFDFLFDQIKPNYKITEAFILKLHQILMNSIKPDAGYYRKYAVRITGVNIPTANFLKIPELMKDLVFDINSNKQDFVQHITETHSRFEQIHPFSDGNGRIGRLLIHTMLLRKNLPPAVIKQENKRFYYKYLNKSQGEDEYSQLENFICDSILDGFNLTQMH